MACWNVFKQRGFTLLEMTVAMAVFAVLGVAVSNVMFISANSQLEARFNAIAETTASNIIDDLRFDLRTAISVNNNNPITNGTVLTFTVPGRQFNQANPVTITYTFANGDVTRRDSLGNTRSYRALSGLPMQILCDVQGGTGCFNAVLPANNGPINLVSLRNLRIIDNRATNSVMDNAWGTLNNGAFARPQLRIENVAFNLSTGTQFD
jgi:prepilin-type N-terminal cleavage/methylation domain-containing protein